MQWSYNCDFEKRHFAHEACKAHECELHCARNSKCTHFAWASHGGGTCWLKSGSVSKRDAEASSQPNILCGLMKNRAAAAATALASQQQQQQQKQRRRIEWRGDTSTLLWSEFCDFPDRRDLRSMSHCPRERCGPRCVEVRECTHFTWIDRHGGTCVLKSGGVSRKQAINIQSEPLMLCGFVVSKGIYIIQSIIYFDWNRFV